MMDRIREEFTTRPTKKKDLWKLIKSVADEISEHGVFSFLLSDSKNMYAYCTNRMCWVTRQYPFGEAHLIDTGETIDFNTRLDKDDVITVIASHALTDNEQ